ncbi:hypothetical protein KAZ82_01460, partial [Candidatus Babeliales bacterium]|nr:hypothetical protein [Candidatus Babeliales bacterium]
DETEQDPAKAAQAKAAQAAELRFKQQQAKGKQAVEIKSQEQRLFVKSDQSNDLVEVIQLAVLQQADKKNWSEKSQYLANLEGGNCGYHALLNVLSVIDTLGEVSSENRCAFRGSSDLKNNQHYLDFVSKAALMIQGYRKEHEQSQLQFEQQQFAQAKSAKSQEKKSEYARFRAMLGKVFRPRSTKNQTPQERVQHWINTPNWIQGQEIDALIADMNNLELVRGNYVGQFDQQPWPVMVVEPRAGFILTDQEYDNFNLFVQQAPVGGMLGLILNTGSHDGGIHWISMVAVKCVGNKIVLYVMDSGSAKMNTNVAGIVAVLSGEAVEPQVGVPEKDDMDELYARLSHPDLQDRDKLFHRVIDPILRKWQNVWIYEELQLNFILLLQQLVENSTPQELEEFLFNRDQLRINLTGSPEGGHEVNAQAFDALETLVNAALQKNNAQSDIDDEYPEEY